MDFTTHRSVRKYTAQSVTPELLSEILQVGIRASNTGNMQTYAVIVTRETERKRALAPLHFNQPMVTQAPVVLTFCADFNRFTRWCELSDATPGYGNFMGFITATIDAMLFAQNVAAAAEQKGLGICYLGTTLYSMREHCELLKLPKGVIPLTTITMGYPDELPPLTQRLPLEAIVHHEEYRNPTDEQLLKLYADTDENPVNQRFIEENGKQTLAQVFTDVRYRPEDYKMLSKTIRETLQSQGFTIL